MKTKVIVTAIAVAAVLAATGIAMAFTPVPVVDDPLVRMPGTQPNMVALEGPNRCLNCHAGYNTAVEPGFNWKGSMMAQAARDFIFWSCMTVSAQDGIWAVGQPNATDICERCHFPKGWLEGRSDPTNASLMTGDDFDGVQCDFCHRMWDPFFETTYGGTREGNDWLNYWDETNLSTTPSDLAADATYAEDANLAPGIIQFNQANFFSNNLPPVNYIESGSGQYFVSPNAAKRASFADANARHQMLYSRYHKSKYFCGTCHDVSNPILANLGLSTLPDAGTGLITEQYSAFRYLHVERTFSEFMLSEYGLQGGAPTNTDFQAQGAPDITWAARCQDCHMRDVSGVAANKNGAIDRPTGSVEHPNSGQPLHDQTGGNVWVPWVLASSVPASPNYDATNDGLLNQGPAVLTLDLTAGQGLDPAALLAGVDRARQQLLLAATIKDVTYDAATGDLSFRIQNNSAHKLISGFPEGRRMFVNIKAFDGSGLIYEANPYDPAAGTLKGLSYPYLEGEGLPNPAPLGADEVYLDELVYEMKPTSDLTVEDKTFHFALSTGRYKDNRIPPKGFRIAEAAARHSVPVWHGVEDQNYFTSAEYTGGYDEASLTITAGADYVEVSLYYQTTSREYMEFLRDEIRGTGNLTLPTVVGEPGPGDPANYVIQTDPFFTQLKAWGDVIWNLWTHNMNVDGAKPFLMASATAGAPPQPPCDLGIPTLDTADPAHAQVTLGWSSVTGATGYNVYYDQAGKAQLVADAGNSLTYPDTGLTNTQEYCYKVTAYDATCESGFSNILCATPTPAPPMGVSDLQSGVWVGRKNPGFQPQESFAVRETVVLQATVVDEGLVPVADAVVTVEITDSGGALLATVISTPSDASGLAYLEWKVPRGAAGGLYTATVIDVQQPLFFFDGVPTADTFTVVVP